MVAISVTPEERQQALLEELRKRGKMDVVSAWAFGNEQGFYSGAAWLAKADLEALCQSNQAKRHDGFWRHINEADREKYMKSWADYWTPKGSGPDGG